MSVVSEPAAPAPRVPGSVPFGARHGLAVEHRHRHPAPAHEHTRSYGGGGVAGTLGQPVNCASRLGFFAQRWNVTRRVRVRVPLTARNVVRARTRCTPMRYARMLIGRV